LDESTGELRLDKTLTTPAHLVGGIDTRHHQGGQQVQGGEARAQTAAMAAAAATVPGRRHCWRGK